MPAVIRCVHPCHARNRATQIVGKFARVITHDRQVFPLRHFVFADPISARERHGGLRPFVAAAVQIVRRAAHRESIGRDKHHVGARGLKRAIKFLRRELRSSVDDSDAAE